MLTYLSFRRLRSALLTVGSALFRLLSYLPGTFECGESIARAHARVARKIGVNTLPGDYKVRGPR